MSGLEQCAAVEPAVGVADEPVVDLDRIGVVDLVDRIHRMQSRMGSRLLVAGPAEECVAAELELEPGEKHRALAGLEHHRKSRWVGSTGSVEPAIEHHQKAAGLAVAAALAAVVVAVARTELGSSRRVAEE